MVLCNSIEFDPWWSLEFNKNHWISWRNMALLTSIRRGYWEGDERYCQSTMFWPYFLPYFNQGLHFFGRQAADAQEFVSAVQWWLGGTIRLGLVPVLWLLIPEIFMRLDLHVKVLREADPLQNGWIFGKVSKRPLTPPLIFGKLCCKFFKLATLCINFMVK